jgi:hypothetical protein
MYLDMKTITIFFFHEEIKSKLNSRNAATIQASLESFAFACAIKNLRGSEIQNFFACSVFVLML